MQFGADAGCYTGGEVFVEDARRHAEDEDVEGRVVVVSGIDIVSSEACRALDQKQMR